MDELFTKIDAVIEDYLKDFTMVTAEALGLDRRSHHGLIYASEDAIVVQGDTRSIDYYGGFEYIKGENRRVIGDYTFYLAEGDERVQEALTRAGILDAEEEED